MLMTYGPEVTADVLGNAEQMCIDHPVLLLLRGPSERANRIAGALKNSGVNARTLVTLVETGTSFVVVSRADACRLLRQYAGPGGRFIADILESTSGDFHVVALMENDVGMAPIQDGAEQEIHGTSYDEVRPWHETAEDRGASGDSD
jgi:hypothetical protein